MSVVENSSRRRGCASRRGAFACLLGEMGPSYLYLPVVAAYGLARGGGDECETPFLQRLRYRVFGGAFRMRRQRRAYGGASNAARHGAERPFDSDIGRFLNGVFSPSVPIGIEQPNMQQQPAFPILTSTEHGLYTGVELDQEQGFSVVENIVRITYSGSTALTNGSVYGFVSASMNAIASHGDTVYATGSYNSGAAPICTACLYVVTDSGKTALLTTSYRTGTALEYAVNALYVAAAKNLNNGPQSGVGIYKFNPITLAGQKIRTLSAPSNIIGMAAGADNARGSPTRAQTPSDALTHRDICSSSCFQRKTHNPPAWLQVQTARYGLPRHAPTRLEESPLPAPSRNTTFRRHMHLRWASPGHRSRRAVHARFGLPRSLPEKLAELLTKAKLQSGSERFPARAVNAPAMSTSAMPAFLTEMGVPLPALVVWLRHVG